MKNSFKKLTSLFLAAMILFGAVAVGVAGYANTALLTVADAVETDEVLSLKTEIHSYSEELGEWFFTDTVKPGENVKARLFVDTNYFTHSGTIIVFNDKNFFTDSYLENITYSLAVNGNQNSSAYLNGAEGKFVKGNSDNTVIMRLIEYGYITQEFFESHTAFLMVFNFSEPTPQKISGEHWFVEFDLQVLDSANGEGSFFIVPETIMNTTDGFDAYINVPVCEENGNIEDSIGMFAYDVEANVEDYPVHIIENSPDVVTVTLDANGGMFDDGSEIRTVEGVVGAELQVYDIPERDGFIFAGWDPDVPATFPAEDMTFTAVWQHESYTLDYVLLGDVPDWADVPYSIQAIPGELITIAETPIHEGYDFDGWYYDGTKIYDSFVMPEQDVTLEGMWRLREYDVVFDADGGEFADGSSAYIETLTFGSQILGPEVPSREGFQFVGWQNSEGIMVGNLGTVGDDNSVFYAVWEPVDVEYTVEFYYMNSDGMYPETPDYTEKRGALAFEEVELIPECPEGFGINEINSVLEAIPSLDNSTVLKVYFDRNVYDLITVVDGNEEVCSYFYGSAVALPTTPVKEGYEFAGWYNEEGYPVEFPYTMPAESITLTANWVVLNYDAIFNFHDGTQNISGYNYGDQIIMPDVSAPEGFEFKGWADENGNLITEPVVMGSENVSFYAVFDIVTRSVTYIANGITYAVPFGSEIPVPDAPVIDGYVFVGWSPEIPSTMPDEDLMFNAEFKRFCKADKFDVSATFDKDCFSENAKLSVEKINGTNEPGGFYFNEQKYVQVALYNIKIVDAKGEVLQPQNGKKVTVKMALPDEYKNRKDFIVNHWFADGRREQLRTANGSVKVEGGYLIFETGSFSEFEIFVKSAATVSKLPDKTVYTYKGGKVDLSGIEVLGENGEKVTDISNIHIINDIDTSKIGEQTVTVEYGGSTAEFNVNVEYAWWQWIIRILLLGFIWY